MSVVRGSGGRLLGAGLGRRPPLPSPRPVRPCGRTDELCARNGRTDGWTDGRRRAKARAAVRLHFYHVTAARWAVVSGVRHAHSAMPSTCVQGLVPPPRPNPQRHHRHRRAAAASTATPKTVRARTLYARRRREHGPAATTRHSRSVVQFSIRLVVCCARSSVAIFARVEKIIIIISRARLRDCVFRV